MKFDYFGNERKLNTYRYAGGITRTDRINHITSHV